MLSGTEAGGGLMGQQLLIVRFRLLDVVHNDNKLYLVFEFLDLDLKRYMESVKQDGFSPSHVKVGLCTGPVLHLLVSGSSRTCGS